MDGMKRWTLEPLLHEDTVHWVCDILFALLVQPSTPLQFHRQMGAPCSRAFPVFLNLNTFIMHSVGLYVLVGTLVYAGACVKARRELRHHPLGAVHLSFLKMGSLTSMKLTRTLNCLPETPRICLTSTRIKIVLVFLTTPALTLVPAIYQLSLLLRLIIKRHQQKLMAPSVLYFKALCLATLWLANLTSSPHTRPTHS